MTAADTTDEIEPPAEIAYADWGVEFFRSAVTPERVLAGINVLAGQPIDVGPMGVGPGRLVKVRAKGEIGEATGDRVSWAPVSFAVTLPVSLQFEIDLGVDTHRFDADISIPLTLSAHARDDLSIFIGVRPPSSDEVTVRLNAKGLRASVLQHAAGVESELRRFVAKYVTRELDKPYVAKARTIDVSAAINRAMDKLGPRQAEPEQVAADFDEALEAEIRESEALFTDVADGGGTR